MFDKVKEIIEGWRNHLIPPKDLKELIEEVSEKRLAICKPCEFNSTKNKIKVWSKCTDCGCPLIQKSKSLQSKCPKDKWEALTTKKEAQYIKNGKKHSPESTTMETDGGD